VQRARPIPPDLRERLGKLVPRLGSPFDGERVATVAAIERLLRAHNRDWHDLTATLAIGQMQLPLDEKESRARSSESAPPPAADDRRPIAAARLVRVISAIEARKPASLGERSSKFLGQLRAYADEYDPVRLSPKQMSWLKGLAVDAGIAVG